MLTTLVLILCLLVWFKKEATIYFAASLSIVLCLVIVPAFHAGDLLTVIGSTLLATLGIGLDHQYVHLRR